MLQDTVDTRQFRFSAIVDEAYKEQALQLMQIEDRLNQDIELSAYTDKIKVIYFIPIIYKDGKNEFHEEEIRYDPASGQVYIQQQISIDIQPVDYLVEVLTQQLFPNDPAIARLGRAIRELF